MASAPDVFVQELGAILAEERVFGYQLCKSDRLGKLGTELSDLNERLEIAIVDSFSERFQVKSGTIPGVGETRNRCVQQLLGSNVITDLGISLVEVNKFGFLLIITGIVFRVISFLGFTLFIRANYKPGIVSRVCEGKNGISGPSLMSNVALKADLAAASGCVRC